jgi:regulatory protein
LDDRADARAYLYALTLLARRELTVTQVRQRLVRRQFDDSAIEAAIGRLIAERALDDTRVATAMARDAVVLKHRGRRRVLQALRTAGIAPDTAERAVQAVFGELDPDALIEAALQRRLRSGTDAGDPKVRARLYRYLVGQGFEPDRVIAALRGRRSDGDRDADADDGA